LVGAGVLVGFAFLTKLLQAFLVLPAFALVYWSPRRRRSASDCCTYSPPSGHDRLAGLVPSPSGTLVLANLRPLIVRRPVPDRR
jgi:hypothetical protein